MITESKAALAAFFDIEKNRRCNLQKLDNMAFLPYNINVENKKKNEFQVIFYRDKNKKSRFIDFLNSLDTKMRAKVMMSVGILEEKGTELRKPFTEPLDDGIFELRTIFSNNIVRSLFFFFVDKKIIITHGFIKKTQKTPKKEIDLAKKLKKDYLERYGK